MSIKVREIDHVVLRVSDPERSIAFYSGILGCKEERRVESVGLIQLRAGSCLIDLVDVAGTIGREGGAAPGAQARNMDHFCLRVEPFDAAAITAELVGHGIEVGEVARRFGAEGIGPSLYIRDPDGNTVELKGAPFED